MPFLCARVFGAACAALAFASPSSAQPPEGAGAAQPCPPVQGQSDGQADRSERPTGRFSVPVRIIENPIEAKRTEEREERAEKREADDLVAQQRAALAAERAAGAAWAQAALTFAGTVALIWTLLLTRRSVALARQSADAAVALADMEAPALFVWEAEIVEFHRAGEVGPDGAERVTPTARLHFGNYGRTPAVLLGVEGNVLLTRRLPPEPYYGPGTNRVPTFRIVKAGEESGDAPIEIVGGPLSEQDVRLPGGLGAFYVYGRLIYRDPFGGRAETGFGYGVGGGGQRWNVPFEKYNYRKAYKRDDPDAPHAKYEQ